MAQHDSNGHPTCALAEQVLQIVPRLNRWAETRTAMAGEGVELSLRQLSALTAIEGDETTLGDVARRLMVTPAVVTGLIDRLERRGYVRRVGGSVDRRRVHLALTDSGRAARAAVERHLVDELAARLAALSVKDRDAIERGLGPLRLVAADLEARTPADL